MREIRFRYVWQREDGHVWVEVVPIECLEGEGDTPHIHTKNNLWELISRDQYTGLNDKNGVEVFEYDLLKGFQSTTACGGKSNKTREFLYNVYIIPEQGAVLDPCGDIFTGDYRFFPYVRECEVIGNIHENPELLDRTNEQR